MPYTFDDAVHVLGLEPEDFDYSHPDDEPVSEDVPSDANRFSLTITWDDDPEFATWVATFIASTARNIVRQMLPDRHATITFRDAAK